MRPGFKWMISSFSSHGQHHPSSLLLQLSYYVWYEPLYPGKSLTYIQAVSGMDGQSNQHLWQLNFLHLNKKITLLGFYFGLLPWITMSDFGSPHYTETFMLSLQLTTASHRPSGNISSPQWQCHTVTVKNTLHLPVGGHIVEFKHSSTNATSQLPKDIPIERHVWVRLRDPNCDKRKLSDSSRDTIRWSKHSLLPLLSSIPLNRSAHLTVNAAADACAVEETVGIGGWVQLDSNMFWFSQTWKKSVVKRFLNRQVPTIPLPQDIDVDLTSNSGSWLVVSQSQQSLSSRTTPCTLSTARQTSSAIQIQDTKLRARIREGLCDASHALPPPNPPKFRPTLWRITSTIFTLFRFLPSFTLFEEHSTQTKLLQASAKSLPSPARFHHPIKFLQSTEDKETIESDRARHQLREIFHGIGFSSKLYCEIHNSAFLDRIADSVGTGGLLMYLQVWRRWACWCSCQSFLPAEAPLSLVLDYLHASDHLKKKKNSQPF